MMYLYFFIIAGLSGVVGYLLNQVLYTDSSFLKQVDMSQRIDAAETRIENAGRLQRLIDDSFNENVDALVVELSDIENRVCRLEESVYGSYKGFSETVVDLDRVVFGDDGGDHMAQVSSSRSIGEPARKKRSGSKDKGNAKRSSKRKVGRG